ncbi:hypothetical protein DH2020_012870 [Rehmannia glutinosa]|uniref:Uncharacterized protein n=1 Tax=Rehmannia glutinosa TaxID=99300 RepID=A0ABR0X0Y9_REHGL
MVAEAKDQIAASSRDPFFVVSSQLEPVAGQSKSVRRNGNGHTLKVRKPYTITKQRERWTEDEHQKFVEALKLYGRAWRQIEEHVGTKSAIQIRSHAQKFFAKVMRDSNIDAAGCLNPIEIPPPRSKKKPLHPYPRKIVDSANTQVMVPHRLEKSHSPYVSLHKRADRSPTSVSCATDAHSAHSLFTERDDEYMTSEISAKEEIGSRLSMKTSFESLPDDKSTMKFELFPREAECSKEEPSYTSIKLFGKTVVVRDTLKQSSDFVHVKLENNTDELVQGLRSTDLYSQAPSILRQHSLNNLYCYMENIFSLPLCSSYQDTAHPSEEGLKIVDPPPFQGYLDRQNTDKKESAKGFMAYKRCLAERDGKSPGMSFSKEQEGPRVRVCS